ncbi:MULTISPECIES: S8 family serine peptidase [unclassified Luteimonas]
MLKKNTLGLAVAGIVLATAAVGPNEAAVGPKPPQVAALRTVPVTSAGGDRLIVKYRAGAAAARSLGGKLATVNRAAARALVATARAGIGASIAPVSANHVRAMAVGSDVIRLSRKLGRNELDHLVRELSADPAVEYAEIDARMYPLRTPNDPHYASHQWHLQDTAGGINLPPAWDLSTGEGVVVAVLDTGVLPAHPDLGANLLEGYDFITNPFMSRRATADRVPGGLDLGDWTVEYDECYAGSEPAPSSWHGTHVSGTIAQLTDNAEGVAGVAFDARVLPVRVLGRCGGQLSDISDAIVWASGGGVAGVPANENPAEVINMSLGGYGSCGPTYQDAIDIAVGNGSVVVVAAGNSAENASDFRPASCANVINVGANRYNGGIAFYSNHGTSVDISAPGGGAWEDPGNSGWDGYIVQSGSLDPETDQGNYDYVGMIGTSMAAPHVAGAAALVQGALVGAGRDPLDHAGMEALFKQTARVFPVAIPASTPIGVGILNVKAALDKALEVPCEVDCAPDAIALVNKAEVRGLSNTSNDGVYSFEAAAGQTLSFLTMAGSGNVSIFASRGVVPTEATFDAKSTRAGNTETIRFTAPQAGTYYVRLTGVYAGLTLVARQ